MSDEYKIAWDTALLALAELAARAPAPQWDADVIDPDPMPAPDVIPDDEYSALVAAGAAGGGRVERVRNLAAINEARLALLKRKRAQWPWVWALAVMAERERVLDAARWGEVGRS